MRVAYLVNQYPKVSHSFIRREIQALEASGVEVLRYAVRGWSDALPDLDDVREREKTQYILRGGVIPLIRSALTIAFKRPKRVFRATCLASQMALGGDRGFAVHLAYLLEAALLVQWMEASDAQHLHCHFGTNPASVGALARVLGGPTFSFTVHGPEEFDKPARLKLREKAQRAAFIVAISSFGRSQLYRWLDSKDWVKCHVVRCGLEVAFHAEAETFGTGSGSDSDADAHPAEDAAPLASLRMVCVGRLCEQKGQLLLVEALAAVRRSGIQMELVLAGDGEMRVQIEALALALNVADAIRITGWISSAQVREEILAARALVLPSFAEGLPVVLMEALSLRRPVVSTYVAGIPELVIPGVNGWLAIAGDVQSLADALSDCLTSPLDRLRAMGHEGRSRVLDMHDVGAEVGHLKTLFESAVSGADELK